MKKKIEKRIIFIAILMLIAGYMIGFMHGTYVTTVAVVDIASRFVDIDYQAVNQAIQQYHGKIKGCYPIQNASLYSDEGN